MSMNTRPPTWASSLNNAKNKAAFWKLHGAPINDPKEAAEKNAAMKWGKIIENGERWMKRGAANQVERSQKNVALKAHNKAIKLWNVQPQEATNSSGSWFSKFSPWGGNYTYKRKQKRNRTKRTKRTKRN